MGEVTNAIPYPGSDEAVMRGCRCPILDNAHGKGYRGQHGVFVIAEDCPVHMPASRPLPLQETEK